MISVIVTVYNIEKYIGKCLDSILGQDYFDWECIIVNDGSTDNSEMICKQYSERYRKIKIISQNNGGPSKARNTGIMNAIGDYLLFLDGDDLLTSNALKHFSMLLGSCPDMVIGHMNFFSQDINELFPLGSIVKDEWVNQGTGKEAFINIYKNNGIVYMGLRGLYKRKFIVSNNLFFQEDCRYSEDQDWIVRCFERATIVRSNENRDYLYRRGRDGSLMNTLSPQKIKDTLQVYDGWYRNIMEHEEEEYYICLYDSMINRYWDILASSHKSIMGRDRKEFCKIMTERKYFARTGPRKINLKRFLISYCPTSWICQLTKIWIKLHGGSNE